MIMTAHLQKLANKGSLQHEEMQQLMHAMLEPEANPYQVAACLSLLRAKGETADELAAMIKIMQQQMLKVAIDEPVLDIVGTGGDGFKTLNISTASAILAASCGVKVVKHGNRAVSSQCGSADVLEEFGVSLQQTPEQITASVKSLGIGFCFAPNFHPSLQRLRVIRKALGIPTSLNLIAPLMNPASPAHYLFGVADKTMMDTLAQLLAKLTTKRSVIFHSEGLDELTCLNNAEVIVIEKDKQHSMVINPELLGLSFCTLQDLIGGDAKYNAAVLRETLASKKNGLSDTLILNAGMACFVYGLVDNLQEGVNRAKAVLASGSALNLLDRWICNQL